MRYLTRFRADPALVRVAIRHHKGLWYVSISSRPRGRGVIERMHKSPTRALVLALRAAESVDFPGIDLGMGWSYDHPQRHLAPKERVSVFDDEGRVMPRADEGCDYCSRVGGHVPVCPLASDDRSYMT